MNNLEVLYVHYDDVRAYGRTSIELLFTTLGGKFLNHVWSKDKNQFGHVYNQMNPGTWYVVVTEKQDILVRNKARWVYKHAFACDTKEQVGAIYQRCGRTPTVRQFNDAVFSVLVEQRNAKAIAAANSLLKVIK